MRILAVSDIHGNAHAVRQVQARDRNKFDAVVVPGDIGSTNPKDAEEVFGVLSTFKCPVLYVYGNGDYDLPYSKTFGERCHHLHLQAVAVGGFTFIGMSGCPASQGQNPIAEAMAAAIQEKYRAVITAFEAAKIAVETPRREIETDHEERVKGIAGQAKDRRRKQYRAKLRRLEDQRDRLLEKAYAPVTEIMRSDEYYEHSFELKRARKDIERANRHALVEIIHGCGVSPERIVVVTHDRLYRMQEDAPGVLLYVFGHKHKFWYSPSRLGSHFVRVGALHNPVAVVPEEDEEFNHRNTRGDHHIECREYAGLGKVYFIKRWQLRHD